MRSRILVSPAEKRNVTIDRSPVIKSREICTSSGPEKQVRGLIVCKKAVKLAIFRTDAPEARRLATFIGFD